MKKVNLNSPIYRNIPETLVMGHFVPWFTQDDPKAFAIPSEYAGNIIEPEIESWRHWRDCRSEYSRTHLYQPLYGEYDSRDPLIIKRQIHDAVAYGLDGFIININGKNSVENIIALSVLQEIKEYNSCHQDRPFLYIISFDSKAQSATEGKTPVSIEEDFQYLRDFWLTDAWVRNGDKPILMIFAYNSNFECYQAVADNVFDNGADIIWPSPEPGVKAAYCWVRPDKIEENGMWLYNNTAGVEHCRKFYRNCADSRNIDYIVGGVWPGFNDTLVRWAWDDGMPSQNVRPRIICRNTTEGNTLELTWREVIDYISRQSKNKSSLPPMPIVQIVTWNDWAESTSVEPDMESGYKNLEICSKYIKKLITEQEVDNEEA